MRVGISSLFLGVPLTPAIITGVLLVVGSTCLFNTREMRLSGPLAPDVRTDTCNGSGCSGGYAFDDGRGHDEETEPLQRRERVGAALSGSDLENGGVQLPTLEYVHACSSHRGAGQTSPQEECIRRSGSGSSPRFSAPSPVYTATSAGVPTTQPVPQPPPPS